MAQQTRLESWKEIATHIGRDERTAMRWEALGMPVHRSPGERRGRVYGFVHEIDAWLAQHAAQLRANGEKNGLANGALNGTVPTVPPSTEPAPPTTPPPAANAGSRYRLWLVAAASLLLVAVATSYALLRPGTPVRFEVNGSKLTVLDKDGRVSWSRDFGYPLNNDFYRARSDSRSVPRPEAAQFFDLDGDGAEEFLFSVFPHALESARPGYLACFDSRGNLRWKYAISRTVRFGSETLTPPFITDSFYVSRSSPLGRPVIWVNSHHAQWFPTQIAKLDIDGQLLAEFWHAGHIDLVSEALLQSRRVILLGGTNNETFSASLAVLDFETPQGSSPATNPTYACGDCSEGGPLWYFLVPRAEISRMASTRPVVSQIWPRGHGKIDIFVDEPSLLGVVAAGSSYAFDEKLDLLSAEVTETYVVAHNELWSRQKLDHPLDRDKESAALRMLRWDAASRRFVEVPRSAPRSR